MLESWMSFAEQVNRYSTKLCVQKPRVLVQGGSAQRAGDGRKLGRQGGRGGKETDTKRTLSLCQLLCKASLYTHYLVWSFEQPIWGGGYYFPNFPLKDFRPRQGQDWNPGLSFPYANAHPKFGLYHQRFKKPICPLRT